MNIQGKVWGTTSPLFNRNNVELHYVDIKKGGFCSKHLHKYKFNQFIVFSGKLKITVWKEYNKEILQDVSIISGGQHCIVSPNEFHKFEALEDTSALEVYWVELNVNDIVRLDHGGLKADDAVSTDGSGVAPQTGDRYAILSDKIDDAKRTYAKFYGND